jgi:hypothetical protein
MKNLIRAIIAAALILPPYNAFAVVKQVSTVATSAPVTGLTGAGTGVTTALGVNVGTAGAVVVNGGALGTPSSGSAANLTGLPVSTGVSGLGTGVATLLATHTVANLGSALSSASGGQGVLPMAPYVSTQFALMSPLGAGLTAANATPLVTNTEYCTPQFAAAPISIHSIGVRTSTTNASSGAALKVCVYAADGTNGSPSTLLGSTASGTSITDSATSTDFNIVLDANTSVPAGMFWVCALHSATTGARLQEQSGAVTGGQILGATSQANLFNGVTILGNSVSRTYASGCLTPYTGGAAVTSAGLAPAFAIEFH